MSGERPVTVRGPEEGDWGREEGEGEQERVKTVMRLLHSDTGETVQENTTSLSPAIASKLSILHAAQNKER